MSKRIWCTAIAALLLAGQTYAQDSETGPTTLPAQPTETLTPMADLTRTGAGADLRIWGSADYLFTFMRGTNLPPLVTTSPAGTAKTVAGALGRPTTGLLFGGDERVTNELRAGFRVAAGVWFNSEQTLGIEGGFMMIGSQAAIFSAGSGDGSSILARPFIDANSISSQAVLVAFPGSSNGTIDIRMGSGNLYGAHLDLAEKAYDEGGVRFYSLVGYRFFRYDENLRVQQVIAPTVAPFVPGTLIVSNDNFTTRNQFHGLDLGVRSQFTIRNNMTLEVLTRVSVGRLHRDIDIGGNQTSVVPGADPVTRIGGVLALTSNGGSYAETDWRAIPEVGVTFGWQIRPNVALRAGYSLLYFNQVARAADQVDLTINPHLLPGANAALGGPSRPAFNLIRTDLWLQSINLGLEFTY